ncbi:HIT family protein [Candidatus Woesearchaeota archaeon]|nr:HIT family protein [Candidatus Woesearchaeota archaeon]
MKRELLEKKDRIIYEDDIAAAVLVEKPAAKGHIVIIPKQEVKMMDDLSEEHSEHLFYLASYAATMLFETIGAQGTNIITYEGEEFYMEVIARMQDDGLNFQWKPKQLQTADLDAATSSISGKIIVPKEEAKEEKPEHPPKMDKKEKEEDAMSDEEENYLLKQLDRIP